MYLAAFPKEAEEAPQYSDRHRRRPLHREKYATRGNNF
jgi:hypothetical protein